MNSAHHGLRTRRGAVRLAVAFLCFTVVAVVGATGVGHNSKAATALTSDALIVSSSSNGNVGGVAFQDEDLLRYDETTSSWSMFVDASDLGITGDIDAFTYLSVTEMLLSLDAQTNLPGIGPVDDSDILRFISTSLGTNTAGTLDLYIDGSDIDLTGGGEDIDGLAIGSGGELLISVNGTASVGQLTATDDDIVAFMPTSTGQTTAGTWSLHLDGSDISLASEDLWGLDVDGGAINLTTQSSFSLGGVNGTGADIVQFTPTTLGEDSSGSYLSPLRFDGSTVGSGGEVLDAIHLGPADTPPPTTTTTTTTSTTGPPADQADLSVAVNAPATVELGESVNYSAVVTNSGLDSATSVQLVASFTGNPTITPPAGCTSSASSFSCALGNLTNGASTNLAFSVTPGSAGPLTADLTISSSTADGDPTDNDAVATTVVTTEQGGPTPMVFSSANNGTVAGISYSDEDLLSYDPFSDTFAILVDGSDLGITGDIDAFTYLADQTMLISLTGAANLPGVGQVDDSDLLRFIPQVLGPSTVGTLEIYFDGSDVGLTSGGEDIDAVSIDENGNLVISVVGTFSHGGLSAADDDLLLFDATSLGPNTAGSWQLLFDGSDTGLAGEDVWGVHLDGGIHLTAQNNFSVSGVSGTSSDVFSFLPTSLGSTTTGSFDTDLAFDGSDRGFGGLMNALHIDGLSQEPPDGFDIVTGFDWTFTDQAQRADNAGITWVPYTFGGVNLELANLHANDVFGVPGSAYTEPRFAVLIDVLWKDVNPSEGVFDWSSIDAIVNDINLNSPAGVGYFLWPNVYGDRIPQWVNTKYGVDFGTDPRQAWLITNGAGDSAYNEELSHFIDEIVSRYGNDPRLVHIDMRTVIDPGSGEWVIDDEIPADAANIEVWANEMHQLWFQAFAANNADVNKLVAVVSRPVYGGNNVLANSFAGGAGQRDGLPLRAHLWREAYGNSVNAEGYVIVDESEPAIAGDGLRYSEVTEYSFVGTGFGPKASTYERFQIGLLWALQVRRSWLGFPFGFLDPDRVDRISNAQLKEDLLDVQEMIRWAQVQVGHTAATASDAWSWTKETEYTSYNFNDDNPWDLTPSTTAKNVERWLYQRDVAADGQTVAVDPTPASQLPGVKRAGIQCSSTVCEDYRARRTDRANGSTAMYFEVDPAFLSAGQTDTTIKITYYDVAGGDWHMEYRDATGPVSTPTVPAQGTGDIRTVTFELPGLTADGQFADGMDFRIVADGPGDATIRFVRLIKGTFSQP